MTLVLKGAYRGERRLRLVRPAQRVLTCRVALHHLSMACIDVPVPGAATARIRTGIVPTRRVRDAVRYALVIPAQCDPRTNEPVVYLLPGRDGRAYAAVTELGFAGIAVELCRDGKAPYAVLAIDAGSTYFHPRSSGEDRLGVVEDDLPRLARELLRGEIRSEALLGQSMSGYGATDSGARRGASCWPSCLPIGRIDRPARYVVASVTMNDDLEKLPTRRRS